MVLPTTIYRIVHEYRVEHDPSNPILLDELSHEMLKTQVVERDDSAVIPGLFLQQLYSQQSVP